MIVEYLRYSVEADRQAAFVADYTAAAEPLMGSDYSINFEMCQCVEDNTQFILRIEWTSAEDHKAGFRGSAAFKQFFGHIRPYLSNIQEMRHYQQLVALP